MNQDDPRRRVRVLLIPGDPDQECGVHVVPGDDGEIDRAAAARLVRGEVQAAYQWRLYGLRRGVTPRACRVYLDGDRVTRRLPDNERATVLAARLGTIDRTMRLLGPVLVVGTGLGGADVDVPHAVVFAALRAGLLANLPGADPGASSQQPRRTPDA